MQVSFSAFAQREHVVDIGRGSDNITNITTSHSTVLESKDNKYQPLLNDLPAYFNGVYSDAVRFSYTDDVLWGKITFTNSSKTLKNTIYFWDNAISGDVRFYFMGKEVKTGSFYPLQERNGEYLYPILNISLKPGQTETLYFKRSGHHRFTSSFFIGSEFSFYQFVDSNEHRFRYYLGAIGGLFAYNLLLVIFFRSRKYLIYCLFILSFLTAILNSHGFMDYLDFIPNSSFSNYSVVTSALAIIFSIFFGFIFLDEKLYLKDLTPLKKIFLYVNMSPIVLVMIPFFNKNMIYMNYLKDVFIFSTLSFAIYACYLAILRKSELAKVYLFSWVFLCVGALLFKGNSYGFIPHNFITMNGLLIGNLFELVILSLGLAYQVAIIDKNRSEILIKAEGKEKYQHLLRTISHDISNSMQVLVLGAKRLKKVSDDPKVSIIAEKIQNSTQNVVEILDQIKTQEKLLQDKESIILSKVNLFNIINEDILIFEDALLEKNIIINVDIPLSSQHVLGERG